MTIRDKVQSEFNNRTDVDSIAYEKAEAEWLMHEAKVDKLKAELALMKAELALADAKAELA